MTQIRKIYEMNDKNKNVKFQSIDIKSSYCKLNEMYAE